MVLFQSVTTALFQCMDQVGLEAVNLEAFAKMRAAAPGFQRGLWGTLS